jgi:hypothetical protein
MFMSAPVKKKFTDEPDVRLIGGVFKGAQVRARSPRRLVAALLLWITLWIPCALQTQ